MIIGLLKKRVSFFLPFDERKIILDSLSSVDEVLDFEDDKLGSCVEGLKKIMNKYPDNKIIFCNGGDRDSKNIPEMILDGIELDLVWRK